MNANHHRALIVLSGGQDSTTCGFYAKRKGLELHAVTFDYGQKHIAEIDSALVIGDKLGVVSHDVVAVGKATLRGSSPLVDSTAQLEQYPDHASLPGGLEKTFVPMRNQLFLTIAANRAFVRKCGSLYTGVCQEDYGGYPDCRRRFIDLLQNACNAGTFTGEPGTEPPIKIETPLMFMTKAQSVSLALRLTGCYEALAYTHTAYDGKYPPNGNDHASLLRAKGFEEADVPDPLVLRAVAERTMRMPNTNNYGRDRIRAIEHVIAGTELWNILTKGGVL